MEWLEQLCSNTIDCLSYQPGKPMLFSGGVFWVLFLLFIPIYAVLKRRFWQMVIFVVAFNFYFYYKSSGIFVIILLFTSLLDWGLSRLMVKLRSRTARRYCVAISLTASLGILGYFKYANFFMWNISAMINANFQPLELILPVGISFYTFQSVSYIIDVYKERVAPVSTWLEYAFFLSFFPALVAGPIVRAGYFVPQIRGNRAATLKEIYLGLWLIIIGVIKKAIIADYISQYNDLIFTSPGSYSGFETLMGIIGYMMQIYCDFSGYSDMAIGLALIMGFKLAKNFNFPYKSQNLTDFWRRWHISLSTWLRDYIYIPLGGNRKGTFRTYINNFVTMLIGGLWHGAAWKFVFWGAMHGAGLAIHKASTPYLSHIGKGWLIKGLSWLLTMTVVASLWVFFRADTWGDACTILTSVFDDFSISYAVPFAAARMLWLIMMSVIIFAHALPTSFWDKVAKRFVASPWIVKLIIFLTVVQLVVELQGEDVSPFIYFQF